MVGTPQIGGRMSNSDNTSVNLNSQIEESRHFLFIFDVHERTLEEVTSVFKRVFVTLATRALIGASGELVSSNGGAL
jgi:hypothetical protein